jgi:RimJ/RimL family protein N-acetyltransferase
MNNKSTNLTKMIYSDESLILEYNNKYDEEFLQLLEDTRWGTEDTLYTMHNLKEEFDKFKEASYIRLKKASKLIGACVFHKKSVELSDALVFYITVFAVKDGETGKGYGTLMLQKTAEYFLSQHNRVLLYAYVEKGNERSVKSFAKLGFRSLGEFKVSTFSRLNPKRSGSVRKLAAGEKSKIRKELKSVYKEYFLEELDQSLSSDKYYVLEEGNEILAGVQVKKFKWTISKLPGTGGKLALKVLPKAPILNKLINPNHYSFLKIGNIYMKDHKEKKLSELLEHLLYESKLHLAMFYSDLKSPVYDKTYNTVNSGILSRTVDTVADIMVKSIGFTKEEIKLLEKRPIHISMLDSI